MAYTLFSDLNINLLKYFFIFIFPISGFCSPENSINYKFKNIPLKSALQELIINNQLSIIYSDSIPNQIITTSCFQCTDDKAISSLLSTTELIWEKTESQYIITLPIHQPEYSISGIIIDSKTGEPIPYANAFIPELLIGDISRDHGMFSIPNISCKSCTLVISYIGYEKKTIPLSFPKDQVNFQTITLLPRVLLSKEISITSSTREFMENEKKHWASCKVLFNL